MSFVSDIVRETFWSSSPEHGPVIDSTMSTMANVLYGVQIEIMLTDTSATNEYATIYLNDENFGDCNPRGNQCGCTYETCSSLMNTKIQPNSTSIKIRIEFSSEVNTHTCQCPVENGEMATGAVRITLTPDPGEISVYVICIYVYLIFP